MDLTIAGSLIVIDISTFATEQPIVQALLLYEDIQIISLKSNVTAARDIYIYIYIQIVTGGTDQTSGECSLGQTIPI